MTTVALIMGHYTRTYELIQRLTDGITHADSMQQWDFAANNLNWLLGHVSVSRWNMLGMLGDKTSIWDFAQAKRYIPGTAPIRSDETVTSFEALRAVFGRTQARLQVMLPQQTPETLAMVRDGQTMGAILLYYAQHEAFHAGQIELCRGMLGKASVTSFE